MSIFIELLVISILVSVTCALVGNFMVLRGNSLTTLALSHSILFGIVLVFILTGDINSPVVLFGAAITGLLIVMFVELLTKANYVNSDAALGIIYLFIFSLGILLVARFASNTTLSPKSVITGNIALVPFNRLSYNSMDLGPELLWVTGGLLLLNTAYILLFWKELKLTTFNQEYALILGYSPTIINVSFMSLVSLTIVGVFKVAGVVMVVALMIIPPATSYLLSKSLKQMVWISLLISAGSAIIGFYISWHLGNIEVASMISIINGLFFLISLLISPSRGLLTDGGNKKEKLEETMGVL